MYFHRRSAYFLPKVENNGRCQSESDSIEEVGAGRKLQRSIDFPS